MTRDTNTQRLTPTDIAKFVTSPWILLTLVVAIVFIRAAMRVQGEALLGLTPSWFFPYGAAVAAVGLFALVAVILKGPNAALRLTGLAFVAFVPAVLFMFFSMGTTTPSVTVKTVFGITFAAAPWLALIEKFADGQWAEPSRKGTNGKAR
ncbi:hypothetical protein [Pandoraea communis]|uniref:hypothetical protein n=1 Tax=Pandoraea communis TaxID=2508297 RepID=UPI0025A4E8F9|nr:hypothetical protein [Pandoraea communis]MDM8356568.1 hypothetical protein [Pandoraea communis]